MGAVDEQSGVVSLECLGELVDPSLTLARHMAGVVGEAGLGNSMGYA